MSDFIDGLYRSALQECMKSGDRFMECLHRQVCAIPDSWAMTLDDAKEVNQIRRDYEEYDVKMRAAGFKS